MTFGQYAVKRLRSFFCWHRWEVQKRDRTGSKISRCNKCGMSKYEFWHIDGCDARVKFFEEDRSYFRGENP